MLQQLRTRLTGASSQDEDGFTLIELMVVVLIIAILIAIAIPTFLGARQKAQDRAAQSNLRNALTAVKTAYVDSQDYSKDTSASPMAYSTIEPSLTWQTAAATKAGQISVSAASADVIVLAAYSASGQCFFVKDITGAPGSSGTPGTSYAKAAGTSCDAAATSSLTFNQTW